MDTSSQPEVSKTSDVQAGDLKLPPSVTILKNGDAKVYVIGTAHVSAKSVTDVEEVIQMVQPDTIVVELCEARYEAMSDPDRWKKMDVVKVVREGRGMLLMANLMLSSFQRRIGDKLGVKPGAEMMRAVELAQQTGARMVLGDRNVQVTLKRTWGGLGFWEKIKLSTSLLGSTLGGDDEVDEAELEKLKEGDVLSGVLEDVGKAYPAVKERLIHERDLWLMDSVYHAQGKKIVAVVGAGHVPGMVAHWGEAVDKTKLSQLPDNKNILLSLLKWGIPSLIILSFVYAFMKSEVGWDAVGMWFFANAILSGLGAACALGHPLTILTAFVAAPFTSLNPMVAAGMVSGLVEAILRKPKVSDCESLANDALTLKGWYKNRITRVLLVVILSNLGSALGTYIGAYGIFKIIGGEG
jgi:pheromone shutdown-related protein TraB